MNKRFSLPHMRDLITVLTVLAIILVAGPLLAQTPVERTFTIGKTATYGSTNYTAGIANPAYTSYKPVALDVLLYATNATVTIKRSTTGSDYYSYAMGTASNAVLFLTNDFYCLRGDTIVVSVGATNIGGVVKMQGVEQ